MRLSRERSILRGTYSIHQVWYEFVEQGFFPRAHVSMWNVQDRVVVLPWYSCEEHVLGRATIYALPRAKVNFVNYLVRPRVRSGLLFFQNQGRVAYFAYVGIIRIMRVSISSSKTGARPSAFRFWATPPTCALSGDGALLSRQKNVLCFQSRCCMVHIS